MRRRGYLFLKMMIEIDRICQAPPNSGQVVLGRSLPSLLNEACDRTPNPQAFNQWTATGWRSFSNQEMRTETEQVAVGLLSLGLQPGDRVALLMYSDIHFCIVDMACLMAQVVDVPIDLTQTLEQIIFVLQHSEARVLIVSNLDLLAQLLPYLWDTPQLQQVIVVEVAPDWQQTQSHWRVSQSTIAGDEQRQLNSGEIPEAVCLEVPSILHPAHPHPHTPMPQCLKLLSLEEVRSRAGQMTEAQRQSLRNCAADQLATIVYIPNSIGQLDGVMLTHENLSANAISSFSGLSDLEQGDRERVLSFLPLNHILARTMLYGHVAYGHSIYFSSPSRVLKHLKEVQPTILVTVPLFLEKIYSKIEEKGSKAASLFERILFHWALNLTKRYELGNPPRGLDALQLRVANWLVLSKWRAVFGGCLKYVICGGAALRAELANRFAAAGITILQGYGLTQASAVVCCNRGNFNRAGTVGVPIAGTEVAIAPDHEILVRGPCITSGYYKNPDATRSLLEDGWLHTGDLGSFTDEGFLQITGLKKALFKLSTGKYIAPQPIEQRLAQSPFVAQAVVIGADQKFCAALIVPNLDTLHVQSLENGIDLPIESLLQHPYILAIYQAIVEAANCHLPYWATVKRFRLVNTPLTVENSLLTPTHQLNRPAILQAFAIDIATLYSETPPIRQDHSLIPQSGLGMPSPFIPQPSSCPTIAQSLNPRLTS